MCQIHGLREEKRKVTFRIGENETEIDFVLSNKEHRRFVQNMKAIPGEFQISFLSADTDKKKLRKAVRKTCAERRNITLLKGVKIRKRFEENVIELVDVGAQNLWGHFKDGVLKSCDDVCGKKRGSRGKGDTWWWNEKVKEAVSRKKDAHNNWDRNVKGDAVEGAVVCVSREEVQQALNENRNSSWAVRSNIGVDCC